MVGQGHPSADSASQAGDNIAAITKTAAFFFAERSRFIMQN